MTDRPLAAVLAAIAAIVFVAAFSAAAVMRPNTAAVAENASSRTAPAAATEELQVAKLVAPSLSRVAALPALHLPKQRKPAKKQAKKPAKPKSSAPVTRPPTTTPLATPTAAPPRVVTPPRSSGGRGRRVGRRQDLRLRGMIRRDPHGRDRPSLRWMAAGLAVALVAAVGGWFVADRIAADPATPDAPVAKLLDAGAARLKVSSGWEKAARPPALPGLTGAPAWTPYAGLATTVSVALVPADDPALVPAALVKEADGGLPKPEKARVVGLEARAYRGVRTGDTVLDVYAIPTTRGVLTLVCAARSGGPEAPTWCLNGLDQITVAGARPITADAGTAYRMRAPAVMKDLDAVRVRERVALRRAKGPVGQRRAARTLWKAYGDAAGELSVLAPKGEPPARVVSSLRDTARAYRGLGDAAQRRSRRAWARARTVVAKAETTLKKRIAAA